VAEDAVQRHQGSMVSTDCISLQGARWVGSSFVVLPLCEYPAGTYYVEYGLFNCGLSPSIHVAVLLTSLGALVHPSTPPVLTHVHYPC
jgi:hypothetical protein